MNRRKIAVIFTGGTIGSRMDQEGWIAPDRERPFELIARFRQAYPELIDSLEFDCCMPYQILSERLDVGYLNMLISCVANRIEEGRYDSIIICHGTDTVQYSAAMLAMLYGCVKIPVYFVTSNYPLADIRANGLSNFYYAVMHGEHGGCGVMVPYRNADGNTYLHRGDRLLAHQTFRDDLYSAFDEYLGYYDMEGHWHTHESVSEATTVTCPDYHNATLTTCSDEILWLRSYPGSHNGIIPDQVRYIMIEAYHSGTLCLNDEWKLFAKRAGERAIPVYVVGIMDGSGGYSTIKEYQNYGLICVDRIPPIAFYCYLWLMISGIPVGK